MTCPRCHGLGPAQLAPFQGPPGKSAVQAWLDKSENQGKTEGDFYAWLAGMVPRDYGRIRYGEMMGLPAVVMPANTPTPFVVTAPRTLQDRLRSPFVGFDFLDAGNVLRARKAGDAYTLEVRLTVTPQVYGGSFSLDLYVGGNVLGTAGPVKSRTVPLVVPAGSPQKVDEDMAVNPEAGWIANGAVLMMRSTVQVTLSEEVLFIRPDCAAP